MISPPRFVAVDDKAHHLQAIVTVVQNLGAACRAIQYDPAKDLGSENFRGVRVLFLDLHLLGGEISTDGAKHYAEIARILEDNIHPESGPYLLVLWTEYPRYCAELVEYIDRSLTKAYTRPLAVIPMEKRKFINIDSGVTADSKALLDGILKVISSSPQLEALLSWEADVLTAAGSALAALLAPIPATKRIEGELPAALDVVMSRLASASVGRLNVKNDPRAAFNAAIAPILADRILHADPTANSTKLWASAITRSEDDSLGNASSLDAGLLNRMLHVALPGPSTIKPTDWGAVVEYPGATWSDDDLRRQIGLTIAEFWTGELKIQAAGFAKCKPCCIRIGAACDYARNRNGPIAYLLATEVPESAMSKTAKTSDAVWKSPWIAHSASSEPFQLYVHARFAKTVLPHHATGWTVMYRIREQLLMQLISDVSIYSARPGTLAF